MISYRQELSDLLNYVGVDYEVPILNDQQQLDVLNDWLLLANVQALTDITKRMKDDHPDELVGQFWSMFDQEVRLVKEHKSLEIYLGKNIANIITTAINKDTVSEGLAIAIEAKQKGSGGIVLALHKKIAMQIGYLAVTMALSKVFLLKFEFVFERVRLFELPPFVQFGYYVTNFSYHYGYIVLLVYFLSQVAIQLSFSKWSSSTREQFSHTNFMYKAYRYGELAKIFKMIQMYRKVNVVIHDIFPLIGNTANDYMKPYFRDVLLRTGRGESPYDALCSVGLLDNSEIKLIKDTLAMRNDDELKILDRLGATYQYKYERLVIRYGKVYQTVAWLLLAFVFAVPIAADAMAQMAMMARGVSG